MSSESSIRPIILCGGAGTRLWPLSRELYPKQLLSLLGGHTLLQQTALRAFGVPGVTDPLLVTNEEHRFLVAEQMREAGVAPASILLEPVGRNTAPAITLAALWMERMGRSGSQAGLMLVMPADHWIRDDAAFRATVAEGVALANQGRLVTFGIVPTAPETGYGYIRRKGRNEVAAFVEKPDVATAQQYLESGEYLWNSGIFLLRADVWLEELERFRPDILAACRTAAEKGATDGEFCRADKAAFTACGSDSIDYAVMERTDRASCVPLDAGWSDIGAWSSLWETVDRDAAGNFARGDVIAHDTEGSLLVAEHRLLATVGLRDTIVIETPDAVLVAHRDAAQDVKEIVKRLKEGRRTEHVTHRRVYRPWGSYEGIDRGERFQVKRLMVKPGAQLSLQMHHHRAEHWIVVQGTARVTRGDEVFLLSENQSTYIPIGTTHRLENPGQIPLELIEVQSGGYLGEDDIVRFEDIYNRHREGQG